MRHSQNISPPPSQTSLEGSNHFNYAFREYAGRILWRLCWLTIWQLCWKRFYPLRIILLKCFRARLSLYNEMAASTWIEMPWNLGVGKYSAIGPRVTIYNLGPITIGSNTVISQDSYLCGGTHDYTSPSMPLIKAPITVGNSVWICAGAFIGPGVSIGDGAVIGARAVITKDVEPWTVVAGNPAKVLKRRKIDIKECSGEYFRTHTHLQ